MTSNADADDARAPVRQHDIPSLSTRARRWGRVALPPALSRMAHLLVADGQMEQAIAQLAEIILMTF